MTLKMMLGLYLGFPRQGAIITFNILQQKNCLTSLAKENDPVFKITVSQGIQVTDKCGIPQKIVAHVRINAEDIFIARLNEIQMTLCQYFNIS